MSDIDVKDLDQKRLVEGLVEFLTDTRFDLQEEISDAEASVGLSKTCHLLQVAFCLVDLKAATTVTEWKGHLKTLGIDTITLDRYLRIGKAFRVKGSDVQIDLLRQLPTDLQKLDILSQIPLDDLLKFVSRFPRYKTFWTRKLRNCVDTFLDMTPSQNEIESPVVADIHTLVNRMIERVSSVHIDDDPRHDGFLVEEHLDEHEAELLAHLKQNLTVAVFDALTTYGLELHSLEQQVAESDSPVPQSHDD